MSEKTYHIEDHRVNQELEQLYDSARQRPADTAAREVGDVAGLHAIATWQIGEQTASGRLVTVQIRDRAGFPVPRSVMTVWASATANGAPATLGAGSYTVSTGSELQSQSGVLASTLVSDARGRVAMTIDLSAVSRYLMVSTGPFVSASTLIVWT